MDIWAVKLLDHWFYGSVAAHASYSFDGDEMRHATKALRLKVGDEIQWTDGRGARLIGPISAIERDGMLATARQRIVEDKPKQLTLGVGILHDATRLEWLVEKTTELGVTSIKLLHVDRSERSKHKIRRLEAKAVSAMKQSGRAWLPDIEELNLPDFLQDSTLGVRLIAHCYTNLDRIPMMAGIEKHAQHHVLLIGPEGDFTEQEVQMALEAGYQAVSLGEARLRTETAAVAGLVILSQFA